MATGDAAVTAVLAEYSALRIEIDRRSHAQQTLTNLALTFSGALLAYAVAHQVIAVLLLQPIVVCALGLLYTDHGSMIMRIGRYLHRHSAAEVARLTGEPGLMRWEESPERNPLKGWRPRWLGPPLLIFVVAPVATVLVSLGIEIVRPSGWSTGPLAVPLPVIGLLWLADIVMIGLVCFSFFFVFRGDALERLVSGSPQAPAASAGG
jgi:hypothetical protein